MFRRTSLLLILAYLFVGGVTHAGDGLEPAMQEDLDGSTSAAQDDYLSQDFSTAIASHERDVVLYEISVATMNRANSGTDDTVHLEVWKGGDKIEEFNLDTSGYNDRKAGETDTYSKIPSNNLRDDKITHYIVRTFGNDAWLPASLVITTRNRKGDITNGSWFRGRQWLSTDQNDASGTAAPAYKLTRSADRNQLDIAVPIKGLKEEKASEEEEKEDAKS